VCSIPIARSTFRLLTFGHAMSLTLRRAVAEDAEDAEFAFGVLKETMRDYAVATWGTWWEEEARREAVGRPENGRGNKQRANASKGFLALDRDLTECHRCGAANCTIAIRRDLA
jgi:hypothetical protein